MRGAVAAAEAAFAAPALRDDGRRAELLSEAAAAACATPAEEIVAVCQAETGLPEVRVRSELERTWRQIEAFGALVEAGDYVDAIIDTADPDARPIPRPDVRRMLVPIGPVAVFGASNFPLAFSTRRRRHRLGARGRLPRRRQGPPVAPGDERGRRARGARRGRATSGSPRARSRCCSPAGSRSARRSSTSPRSPPSASPARSPAAARSTTAPPRAPRPIPVYAEMGSVNPIVVTEAALRARARTRSPRAWRRRSATFGGQLCTKPGVVFVPAGAAGDAFVADVAATPRGRRPAGACSTSACATRSSRGVAELAELAEPAAADGAAGGPEGPGFRFAPAAYRAAAADLAREPGLLEERFGPVVLLLGYRSEEELLEALDRVEGQLTGSLHAEPEDEALVRRSSTSSPRARAGSSSTASRPASRSPTA